MHTVRQWLEQLGLPEYADSFERNALDLELLSELTEGDLEKLGVQAMGHRKKLLKAIESLRSAGATVSLGPLFSDTPVHSGERILSYKTTTAEGERKQVTVLFADLKGSMELLANRDPETAGK